jgi:hypothetical protein
MLANKKGYNPYHLALLQFDSCKGYLQEAHEDFEAVANKKQELEVLSEVLDLFNQIDQVNKYRHRFAWRSFCSYAIPYFLWLTALSIGRQYSYI